MTKVVEFNCETQIETERDMTDAEEAAHTKLVSDSADEVAAQEAAFRTATKTLRNSRTPHRLQPQRRSRQRGRNVCAWRQQGTRTSLQLFD